MKFYSPLTADFFPNDTEDLGDDYSEYEGIPYTGKELTGYRDVIRDAIYEDVKDFYAQLQEIISLWHKIPGEARGSAYVMIKGMLIAAQQLPQK